MIQRIVAPVGHLAGKAKPGSRHVALALDKPTLDRARGAVSGKHRHSDKTLYHRLDASRSDRLSTGTDKCLLRMFGSVLVDDIRQRTQGLPSRSCLVEPPLQEGQHQMKHSIPLLDGFVGLHSEVPQAQQLFEIPVVDFDGLITNDKFCFSRWSVLRLSWWRRPLRLRGTESQRCDTLLDENTHPGGTDGAGMDSSQGSSAVCRRPTPLGSGLPVPPEMGNDDEARDLVHPNSTGGV
jgi:hypothetical protein